MVNIRTICIRGLNFVGYRILNISTFFIVSAMRLDTIHMYDPKIEALYKTDDPYTMLRVTYPLNENLLVIDVGGLTGDWAARMYCLYSCYIDIYEPHPVMSTQAKMNFKNNSKVIVYPFGLSDQDGTLTLHGNWHNASIYSNDLGTKSIVDIKKASDVFNEKYSNKVIGLLKINVEGAEYHILPDLIKNFDMTKIKELQIQFHCNVDNYSKKRDDIREGLSKTHKCTWNYDYIFENWVLK
jgi:FkbM family methyltransferase